MSAVVRYPLPHLYSSITLLSAMILRLLRRLYMCCHTWLCRNHCTVHAHEHVCVIADEYAQVYVISDQTNGVSSVQGAVRLYATPPRFNYLHHCPYWQR